MDREDFLKEFDSVLDNHDAILKAQVEAATLRTVGEWLDSLVTETGMPLFVDYKYVEALRNGKTPEGWERWKKGR